MDEEKGVNRGVQRDDGEGQGGSVAPSREEDEARVAHEDEVERREELLVSSPDHWEGHLVLGLGTDSQAVLGRVGWAARQRASRGRSRFVGRNRGSEHRAAPCAALGCVCR